MSSTDDRGGVEAAQSELPQSSLSENSAAARLLGKVDRSTTQFRATTPRPVAFVTSIPAGADIAEQRIPRDPPADHDSVERFFGTIADFMGASPAKEGSAGVLSSGAVGSVDLNGRGRPARAVNDVPQHKALPDCPSPEATPLVESLSWAHRAQERSAARSPLAGVRNRSPEGTALSRSLSSETIEEDKEVKSPASPARDAPVLDLSFPRAVQMLTAAAAENLVPLQQSASSSRENSAERPPFPRVASKEGLESPIDRLRSAARRITSGASTSGEHGSQSGSHSGSETNVLKARARASWDTKNAFNASFGHRDASAFAQLTAAEKEQIRRGSILLLDALAGRASHGLFSLLDGPAWKRWLFVIQTSDWWQQVVLTASFLHGCTIFLESPNYLASGLDPALDPLFVRIFEFIVIAVYIADVGMKMLYFGGFRDYVSKEWQRNYVIMIFLFFVDALLFNLGLCPMRFARPIRLFVIAGRHRDVRRLASFIPKMCEDLLQSFALPMLGVLAFFGILCVRIYGDLPAGSKFDIGENGFETLGESMRTLLILSTLDNFGPIVTEAFILHPVSFLFFMVFIIFACFFLMSVALGVIFDLYIDDHKKTVTSESKKEEKSLGKAFKVLDFRKVGRIDWRDFKELLLNLRPHDHNERHSFMIFREIAREEQGEVFVDEDGFRLIAEFLPVSFIPTVVHRKCFDLDADALWYRSIEYGIILLDAFFVFLLADMKPIGDTVQQLADLAGISAIGGWGGRAVALLGPLACIRCGTLSLALMCAHLAWVLVTDSDLRNFGLKLRWRRIDYGLLAISVAAHVLWNWRRVPPSSSSPTSLTTSLWSSTPEPPASESLSYFEWPLLQVLAAVAAMRVFRVALHHPECRFYMHAVTQVGPVLMHFGALVLTAIYFWGAAGMEMLARPPVLDSSAPGGARLVNPCKRPVPNFDCASSAMVSVFMMFVEVNWNEVVFVETPKAEGKEGHRANFIIAFFLTGYMLLGIGLCSLLTTLVVEFHKVLKFEEEEHKKQQEKKLNSIKNVIAAMRGKKGLGSGQAHRHVKTVRPSCFSSALRAASPAPSPDLV